VILAESPSSRFTTDNEKDQPSIANGDHRHSEQTHISSHEHLSEVLQGGCQNIDAQQRREHE